MSKLNFVTVAKQHITSSNCDNTKVIIIINKKKSYIIS